MKKLLMYVAVLGLGGCTANPYYGVFYTDTKAPGVPTSNQGACPKVGKAKSTTVLGIISTGDGSIDTAKKNGNITKVISSDVEMSSLWFFYTSGTTTVCGE